MTNPQKNKGDRAELEVARILADQLGIAARRKLGAGRADDTGDIDGLAEWTIEVKSYRDIARAIRDGLSDLDAEQANAGTPYGAVFVRLPGGRYVVAMRAERFCDVVRATLPAPPPAPTPARPEWDVPLPGIAS